MRRRAVAVMLVAIALSTGACRNQPPTEPSERLPGGEDVATAGEEENGDETGADEPVASEPPAVRPELAVEIPLPSPALWVEASQGIRIQPALYRARFPHEGPRHCAAVWFEETRHVVWLEGGETRTAEQALSSAWGRAGAFRDSPVGSNVVCDVTPTSELRCRRYVCSYIFETEGRDWGERSRCGTDPPPGRASDIQRTLGFVPTRHWRRTSPLEGRLSYVCLRSGGRVRCYPLEQGVRRPEPVLTPALSAWSDVRDLAGAGSQACAVLNDGSVHCWGMPFMSDIVPDHPSEEALFEAMLEYSGDPWTPRRIEGLPPAVQVTVGLRFACARTEDGRVFCWGAPGCLEAPRFPSL